MADQRTAEMFAADGKQTGDEQIVLLNVTPFLASRSMFGVMACGWTNTEDAAFGQALAGWMRAIRAPAVLGRLLPSPQSLQTLVEG